MKVLSKRPSMGSSPRLCVLLTLQRNFQPGSHACRHLSLSQPLPAAVDPLPNTWMHQLLLGPPTLLSCLAGIQRHKAQGYPVCRWASCPLAEPAGTLRPVPMSQCSPVPAAALPPQVSFFLPPLSHWMPHLFLHPGSAHSPSALPPHPLSCWLGAGGYENELRAQETVIIC